MNKNILILGGTGMVGRNLQSSFKQNNLEGIFVGRGENDRYNLLDYNKVKQLFSEFKPNTVTMLSAVVGGINFNLRNPAKLIKENTIMGLNILDACVEFGVENLYITSTCCAYPKFCQVPFKEEDICASKSEETNRPYSMSKELIIQASQAYQQQYGLKSTCFVLANLYGPFDNFNLQNSHVIPALIRKFIEAKENKSPQVECWGSGKNGSTREFLYSGDVAEALIKAISINFSYELPINLGTGQDISIYDLAYLIKELAQYEGEIVFNGALDGQPKRRLDVSRAKNILNWESKTSLRDGLIKTIQWYKENKNNIKD